MTLNFCKSLQDMHSKIKKKQKLCKSISQSFFGIYNWIYIIYYKQFTQYGLSIKESNKNTTVDRYETMRTQMR